MFAVGWFKFWVPGVISNVVVFVFLRLPRCVPSFWTTHGVATLPRKSLDLAFSFVVNQQFAMENGPVMLDKLWLLKTFFMIFHIFYDPRLMKNHQTLPQNDDHTVAETSAMPGSLWAPRDTSGGRSTTHPFEKAHNIWRYAMILEYYISHTYVHIPFSWLNFQYLWSK